MADSSLLESGIRKLHLEREEGMGVNEPSTQCVEMVAEPPHYFHSHRCPRKAVETVDDKGLCRQHAKVALRRKALRGDY